MNSNTTSQDPYRNLIVHGLNSVLTAGKITLARNPNYYEIKKKRGRDPETGHLKIDIGGYPSVVIWSDLGHEEIRLSVWWKYIHHLHPRADEECFQARTPLCKSSKLKNFLGVACTADVERQDGKYIMGEGKNHITRIYTRKGELSELKKLQIALSIGYEVTGKFRI